MYSDLTNDEVNFIITRLALPNPSIHVAVDYSNQRSSGEVQAYAKLAGSTWTYYVRSLTVAIGRRASDSSSDTDEIQIDLGPSKVVSRKHAIIQYNGNFWEIIVHGRNGVKIDKVTHKEGVARLFSGNVLDIGGVQMMFVLPDSKPHIAQTFKKTLANLSQPPQQLFTQPPSVGSFNQNEISVYNQETHIQPASIQNYPTYQPLLVSTPISNSSTFVYPEQQSIYQHNYRSHDYSQEYPSNSVSVQNDASSRSSEPQLVQETQNITNSTPKQTKNTTKFIVTTDNGRSSVENINSSSSNPSSSSSLSYPAGKAIFSESQSLGISPQMFDQDLSGEAAKDIKPPFSYSTMISQAILSTEEHMMSLSDIYDWISTKYSYYRFSRAGWQNSIRHNLSLSKAFEKVPRKRGEVGKGMKWRIVQSYKEDFCQKALKGDIIKGKSNSANRAFKRRAAAQAAEEAAKNKSISDVVKSIQQRPSSKENDSSFLESTDTINQSPSNSDQTFSNKKDTKKTIQETVKNDQGEDSTLNSIHNSRDIKYSPKPTEPQSSDISLPAATEKLSTTTPHKLATSNLHEFRSSSKKQLLSNFHNSTTQPSMYTSPASGLATYSDQYPFTSISELTAGTTLATLSTPSPTQRYSHPLLSSVEVSGGISGIIHGIFSQNNSSADSLFGYIQNNNNSNNGFINTMGSMSTVTTMSTIGVSQLEAYTPNRGGSLNNSPNNSFKSHSRSKSATTPNSKYSFDNTNSAKGTRLNILPLPTNAPKNPSNKDSPSKTPVVSASIKTGDLPKTANLNQDLQDHDQVFTPLFSSKDVSKNLSKLANDEQKFSSTTSPSKSLSDDKPFSTNVSKTSISASQTELSVEQETKEELTQPLLSTVSLSDATVSENEKTILRQEVVYNNSFLGYNNQEAAGTVVGLRRNNRHRSSTLEASEDTPDTNNDSTCTQLDVDKEIKAEREDTEPKGNKEEIETESNSPQSDPLSFGVSSIMSSVVISAARTPAPVASKFQLTAPSSAQQKESPSSFLHSVSPTLFWNSTNQYQLSATQTPLRTGTGQLNTFSLAASGDSSSVVRNPLSSASKYTSGVNRLGLLKSVAGESVRRKRAHGIEYCQDEEDDIEMDEEDSDGMGLYSPSKNGTEFTPSIKKIKRSHVTHIPDMQSNQLISAKTDSIGVIGLSLKDAQKHEKATGNLNMAALDNDKDSDSQATSPASQQPSEATFSDSETNQDDEDQDDSELDNTKSSTPSLELHTFGHIHKEHLGVSNSGNPLNSSPSRKNSSTEANTPIASRYTIGLSLSDPNSNTSNNDTRTIMNSIGTGHKHLTANDETVQAIQGLQSLRDLNSIPDGDDNEEDNKNGPGNLRNVDLTRGFHKIGKLAAAAAAATLRPSFVQTNYGNPSTPKTPTASKNIMNETSTEYTSKSSSNIYQQTTSSVPIVTPLTASSQRKKC